MKLTQAVLRSFITLFFLAVAVAYGIAWFAPSIGLYHEDAVNLVTAKALLAGHGYTLDSQPVPVPRTDQPPFFPLLLAVFAAVSQQPAWLKLLPLLATAAWLTVTWQLLRKMGADAWGAILITGITAASPAVIFLSTNLVPESLFALFIAAALLALLSDRMILSGILAGLATLTCAAGFPLIAGCAITLVVRGRFRRAVAFTLPAILLAAPWFGWSLAHATAQTPASILTTLPASEKATVFATNLLFLFSGPFSLLSGIEDMYAALFTVILLGWCLWKRRQLLPDIFLFLYCLVLVCFAEPPQRWLAPVLPLILWLFWRVFRNFPRREAIAAVILILAILPLGASLRRLPATLRAGEFPPTAKGTDDWNQMGKLFGWLRANSAPDAILAANLDPLFYLQTGRKTVRGFAPNGYKTHYQASGLAVTPDQLSSSLLQNGVNYLILTPDPDFAESSAYRRSAEALERGGFLEPVEIPGLSRQYRVLKTGQARFR